MPARHFALLLLAAFLGSCTEDAAPPLLTSREVAPPAGLDSGEPFLASDGTAVYMSWLQRSEQGGHDFLFARYEGGGWDAPRTIVWSDRFFVNWADFPSVARGPDGALWAHWLERGQAGGYDYGVRVSRSDDEGATWSAAWIPHEDGTATEHGFVSSVPVAGELGFVWLDGRGFATGTGGEPPTEQMALYFRAMGPAGPSSGEALIDARVCDCCQTDGAVTSQGPVVVYRDRSPDEIRDIYITRWQGAGWSEGVPVYADGWETGACPVNGPSVAARGEEVAVAWFTAAEGVPHVKVAFSANSAGRFGEPTTVDSGNPSGRVDLSMLDDGSVLVSWLERTGGDFAEVQVRHVAPNGRTGEVLRVSASSSERASGFPRMIAAPGGGILIAWTDVSGAAPTVRISAIDVAAR